MFVRSGAFGGTSIVGPREWQGAPALSFVLRDIVICLLNLLDADNVHHTSTALSSRTILRPNTKQLWLDTSGLEAILGEIQEQHQKWPVKLKPWIPFGPRHYVVLRKGKTITCLRNECLVTPGLLA